MTDELKPVRCGCGGEAVVKLWAEPETPYLVMCEKCKTSSGDYATESEAVYAWNRAMGTDTRTLLRVLIHDAEKYTPKSKTKG